MQVCRRVKSDSVDWCLENCKEDVSKQLALLKSNKQLALLLLLLRKNVFQGKIRERELNCYKGQSIKHFI